MTVQDPPCYNDSDPAIALRAALSTRHYASTRSSCPSTSSNPQNEDLVDSLVQAIVDRRTSSDDSPHFDDDFHPWLDSTRRCQQAPSTRSTEETVIDTRTNRTDRVVTPRL